MPRDTRNLLAAIGCLALLIGAIKPAAAATVSYDVVFTGSGFSLSSGSGTPATSAVGEFHVTLDPAVSSGGTSGISLTFLNNIGLGSALEYNYDAAADELVVGGSAGGIGTLSGLDFGLGIAGFTSGSPGIFALLYSTISPDAQFSAGSATVFVTQIAQVAATPIPAALPLFISALGGLGFVGWRRSKARAA